MSTKSFSTNFSFNNQTANAFVKAIDASTSLQTQAFGNLKILNKDELLDKLNKRLSTR